MFFIPYGTREDTPRRTFPYITALIVIINLIVFAYEASIVYYHGAAGLDDFIMKYASVPADLTDGSPLELGLITALFIHGGLLHVAGNLLYLLPFGDNVEDRLGHFRYIIFYLLCGLVATLTYTLFNASSSIPLIGASGAIAGVLGAYLRFHPRGRVKGFLFLLIILFPITLPAFVFIGYWFVMQIFGSLASFSAEAVSSGTTVAFLAHVGGFIAGLVLAPLLAPAARKRPLPQTDALD
jgi:membrane associated rhomboid family serine protease